jgi:hypothetical protein
MKHWPPLAASRRTSGLRAVACQDVPGFQIGLLRYSSSLAGRRLEAGTGMNILCTDVLGFLPQRHVSNGELHTRVPAFF